MKINKLLLCRDNEYGFHVMVAFNYPIKECIDFFCADDDIYFVFNQILDIQKELEKKNGS